MKVMWEMLGILGKRKGLGHDHLGLGGARQEAGFWGVWFFIFVIYLIFNVIFN